MLRANNHRDICSRVIVAMLSHIELNADSIERN